MFLSAGTKIEKRRRGYTLSLCPICHSIRVFAVYESRRLPHVYHVPLTEGKQVGGFVHCQDCEVRLPVSPETTETVHQSSDAATLWELLLPLALAGEGSFLTMPLSSHAETNIAVIRQFLDVEVTMERRGEEHVLVRVG